MKIADVLWLAVISGSAFIVVSLLTHNFYINFVTIHPYIAGYIKFFILASAGELLVIRIIKKYREILKGFQYKAILQDSTVCLLFFALKYFPVELWQPSNQDIYRA